MLPSMMTSCGADVGTIRQRLRRPNLLGIADWECAFGNLDHHAIAFGFEEIGVLSPFRTCFRVFVVSITAVGLPRVSELRQAALR